MGAHGDSSQQALWRKRARQQHFAYQLRGPARHAGRMDAVARAVNSDRARESYNNRVYVNNYAARVERLGHI